MSAREVWRWTDERGVQRMVGTDELRAALASAILPATTLVWREGMKEWAPASSVPELASAAFAGGSDKGKKALPGEPTQEEKDRRATLVGLPSPEEAAAVEAKVAALVGAPPKPPLAVPVPAKLGDTPSSPGERARPAATLVPPYGGPARELAVPPPPRIPVAVVAAPGKDKDKPKRRITTNEVDSGWATITHSDEDDTIPRRARPSELAAAAAAAATGKRTAPPPPLPRKATLDGIKPPDPPKVDASPEASRPKSTPPPPPPRRAGPPSLPTKPTVPSVRIKPPQPALKDAIDELTTDAKAQPFTMGSTGTPVTAGDPAKGPQIPQAMGVTLTGVAPVRSAAVEAAPGKEEPAPAAAPIEPAKPSRPNPPPRKPAGDPRGAPAPDPTKVTKTLVSPRDTIDSVPGLRQAIADDPSDTAITAPAPKPPPREAAPVTPAQDPSSAVAAFREPPAQTVASVEPVQPPAAQGAAEPLPLPPRASLPSVRPPLPSARPPLPSGPLREVLAVTPPPAPVDDGAPVEQPSLGEVDFRGSGEIAALPRGRLDEQVAVPLSSLVGAGALLIGLVIGAFFVGRASSSSATRLTAHPTLGVVPAVVKATLPPPPKPCWMVKQPAMWAPHASRSIPFDAVATKNGTLAIGYAHDARQAMGIEVDLGSGEVKSRLEDKAKEEIERIVPTPAVEFRVARAGAGGPLRSPVDVPGATAFAVGLTDAGIALASPPDGTPAPLWPLGGDEGLGAATVHGAGENGYTLLYRRGGAIWGGFLGADRKAVGDLVKVAGSGGAVGKPGGGWNGREVAVIFADRPDPEGHYQIRVGHGPPGSIPATTTVLPMPRGGPGGDAFSPDIAGLPDGRWLLIWTEGAAGSRAVRAQTLAPDLTPLGDAIALSPPAGNFGQGVVGVVGNYAATVFLSKGSSSYELWGAVLQCGG